MPGVADPGGRPDPDGAGPLTETPGYNAGVYTEPTFFNYDNAGNPTTSTGVDGAYFERRFSPIGQGFIIKAQSTVGGDTSTDQIIFKNEHRVYMQEGLDNDSQFRAEAGNNMPNFTASQGRMSGNNGMARIHIYFDDTHYRDMVILFSDQATFYYDRGFDAYHPNDGGGNDAYFPAMYDENSQTTDDYVIQGVPYEEKIYIPLKFTINTPKTPIKVEVVEHYNMPGEKLYIYLDEFQTSYPISDGDVYDGGFNPGVYDEGIFITFDSYGPKSADIQQTKDQLEIAKNSMNFFQNNRVGQLQISNPEQYEVARAEVFDTAGRLVYSKENLGNSNQYTIPTGNLSDGVYIVKLTTSENIIIDYKMAVKN